MFSLEPMPIGILPSGYSNQREHLVESARQTFFVKTLNVL